MLHGFDELTLRDSCDGAALGFGVKSQGIFQKGKTSAAYVKPNNIRGLQDFQPTYFIYAHWKR